MFCFKTLLFRLICTGSILTVIGGAWTSVGALENPHLSKPHKVKWVELNKAFLMELGQTAQLKNTPVSITWTTPAVDSRCPKMVACVWAGEVTLSLIVSDQKNQETVKVKLPPATTPQVPILNHSYTIELLNVNPYPGTSHPQTGKKKSVQLRLCKFKE